MWISFASAVRLLPILILHLIPLASSSQNLHNQLLITPPPSRPTHCPTVNVLARQESCQFGQCGEECLSQGAFCCGPAGTSASAPLWICDNGACITSVRGTTGIVDCYDPDNPSGTTQSCIDLQATASCNPTDRCYTCAADAPYCRWETYIASNEPTLRWFSCVETQIPDATFLAATTTPNLPPTTSSSPPTATTTTPPPTQTETETTDKPPLSTPAIIGIAVSIGLLLVALVGLTVYLCLRLRTRPPPAPQELGTETTNPYIMARQPPMELDSRARTRSEVAVGAGVGYFEQYGEGYARGVEEAVGRAELEAKRAGGYGGGRN